MSTSGYTTPGDTSDSAFPSQAESIEAQELGVRKRVELGLSPRRPTAKATPQRPPRVNEFPAPPAALPALLSMIVLATVFLVLANMWDWFPSWWHAPQIVADSVRTVTAPMGAPLQVAGYQLLLADDFSQADTAFAEGSQAGEWRIEHQPTNSSYSIEIWPERIVWSLLGVDDPGPHRVQASALVATHTPWGYAGVIDRYMDSDNFYLFLVDGAGRFMVQVQQNGELSTLKPWTKADFLNLAGSTNTLTVDDDGQTLRFYGNGMLLFDLPANLSAGAVGLVGGAQEAGAAEIRFDWLQLYDLMVKSKS